MELGNPTVVYNYIITEIISGGVNHRGNPAHRQQLTLGMHAIIHVINIHE